MGTEEEIEARVHETAGRRAVTGCLAAFAFVCAAPFAVLAGLWGFDAWLWAVQTAARKLWEVIAGC